MKTFPLFPFLLLLLTTTSPAVAGEVTISISRFVDHQALNFPYDHSH